MRKLLLATVAALGASMGVSAVADAQTASPAPGTVTVRLNGRFRFYGAIINDGDADNLTNGGIQARAGNGVATVVNPTGGNKQSNYGFGSYARLYPGFDGVAANGLKYGASLEIRQDNGTAAGGGQYGSVSGGSNRRGSLYFRREWGYLGTDQLGTVRFGTTDGPSSLFATGTFENFDGGGWNGDINGFLAQSPNFNFMATGNLYGTEKVVYLSPQLYGLDLGVAYEPNTGGYLITSGCGGTTVAGIGNVPSSSGTTTTTLLTAGSSGPGCDRLSSSSNTAENGRRRNLVDVALRYRGTFSGVGVAATAGYIGSGTVRNNSTPSIPGDTRLDGLSIGDFGLAVSFAGATVGGHYTTGRYNGSFNLIPKNVDDGQLWIAGASYTMGPVIVGAHYLDQQTAGTVSQALLGRQRRENGVAAGATYALAPGLSLYASYVYGVRRQNGVDFNGAGSSKTVVSVAGLGTSLSW